MRRPGELQNGAAAASSQEGLAAGVPEYRERDTARIASAVNSDALLRKQAKSKEIGDMAMQNPWDRQALLP